MRRREFIAVFGGMAAWPLVARAQQPERVRRIGVFMPYPANNAQVQARNAAFLQGLQQVGWIVGRNIQIDYRWSTGSADDIRKDVAELIALTPEVIFTAGTAGMGPLFQATHKVPIVFAIVADPLGSGYVDSLAHPGGNATGFTTYDYSISGKWLELLKEIAPRVRRAAVIRDPAISAGIAAWSVIQALAPTVGVVVSPINVNDPDEIERAVTAFARSTNGGLIVPGSATTVVHRDLIIKLAARYELPAVYYERYYVAAGGLISYGPDFIDQFRSAAGYVDRILKGEKPADLPAQVPTKYELAINRKTAKALGLEIRRRSSPAPTRSSSEPQAPTRPADGPRQYARALASAGSRSAYDRADRWLLQPKALNATRLRLRSGAMTFHS
jgi:putative ABC transport system substrate-binding protein